MGSVGALKKNRGLFKLGAGDVDGDVCSRAADLELSHCPAYTYSCRRFLEIAERFNWQARETNDELSAKNEWPVLQKASEI